MTEFETRTDQMRYDVNVDRTGSWSDEIYGNLKGIGFLWAELILLIAVILSLVLIIGGLVMVIKDDTDKYFRVRGRVVQPNCSAVPVLSEQSRSYKCYAIVSYRIQGREFNERIFLSGINSYVPGEPIDLLVLRTNPRNVQLATTGKGTVGWGMIGTAIVITFLAWINFTFAKRYRLYSATQGASALFSLF
jgi:hypothetical protein